MDEPGVYENLALRIDADYKLTVEQKIQSKEILALKYNARARPGDIAEVRPGGYFCEPGEETGRGWNHYCYALVRCPKITYDQARIYMDKIESAEGVLLRKHRYSVATLGLVAGEIRIINRLIDLTGAVVDKNG